MAATTKAPKSGCILFVIPYPPESEDLNARPASFELEIPLADLRQLVLRPVRWLKLIAWGVLNYMGHVHDAEGVLIDEDLPFDALLAGGTYTFVPEQHASSTLMNLEHVSTACSMQSSDAATESQETDSHDSDASSDAELAARDGERCVFTGGWAPETVHFILRRSGQNPEDMPQLAGARGFAFDDSHDPRNKLSLSTGIYQLWSKYHQVFILATDPAFVRNQDVPEPRSPPLGVDSWQARPEPAGETYILQWLNNSLHADASMRRTVQNNTRARFTSADPARPPCARAVNYVYAGRMVARYCRSRADVDRVLSRPLAGVAHAPRRPAELTPMEKLYLLADDPAIRRRRREEEDARAHRVQEWREESAAVGPSTWMPSPPSTEP